MSHESDQTSGWGSALGAFLLGAVTGTTIGLLTAPRAGRETREFLKGAAEDIGEGMGRVPAALQKAGSKVMKSGREAFEQTRQEISGTKPSSHASRTTVS